MLLMPKFYKGEESVVLVINAGGILFHHLEQRAVPSIVILNSYGNETKHDVKKVECRIRSLLNNVAKIDHFVESKRIFTYLNLKAYAPKGELYYYHLHV